MLSPINPKLIAGVLQSGVSALQKEDLVSSPSLSNNQLGLLVLNENDTIVNEYKVRIFN